MLLVDEVCVDYGGMYVLHVCLDFCVVYGVVVCVNVCGVVCCLFYVWCVVCCDVV